MTRDQSQQEPNTSQEILRVYEELGIENEEKRILFSKARQPKQKQHDVRFELSHTTQPTVATLSNVTSVANG